MFQKKKKKSEEEIIKIKKRIKQIFVGSKKKY